jgi:hypothetical protein
VRRRRFGDAPGIPGRQGVWTHFRFHPQVFVILGAALACFYLAREAVPSWIFWLYRDTYRQGDFVMEEAKANEGSPIIRGRIEPGGEAAVLEARAAGPGYALAGVPEVVPFQADRRVRVWWSATAPVVGFGEGRSTQTMPVSALPRLPGLGRALAWSAAALVPLLLAPLVAGLLGLRTRSVRTETLFDKGRPPS